MKEELLWGLLSFQWFLAAPISLASSWIIPEILAAPVSRILWTTRSQLQNKIFFSFQMSFHLLLAKEVLLFPLCLYTFLYIYIHVSVPCISGPVTPQALQHRLPLLPGTSCLHDAPRNQLLWHLEMLLPHTPHKRTWMQKCNQSHLEENFWRAQRTWWHFSYLEANIFLA